MASTGLYEVHLFDANFNFLFNFTDIISIEIERNKNDSGEMVLTLAGEQYDFDIFTCDLVAFVYRWNSQLNVMQHQLQTCYFLRKKELKIDDSCEETLELTFFDATSLLERHVVAWLGRDTATAPSHMLESADDIIKLLFYFNYDIGTGGTAFTPAGFPTIIDPNAGDPDFPFPTAVNTAYLGTIADREFPINLQAFIGLAGPVELKSTFLTVLNAMQTTAQSALSLNDENVWFDIVVTPPTSISDPVFELRTWVGQRGVTRNLTVGPEYGNLVDATFICDWTEEANIIYGLGSGDNETRELGVATDDDLHLDKPFYPIERVITANNTDTVGALQTEAASELQERQPLQFFEGSLLSTPPTVWAEDFEFGDVITASWKGVTFQSEITSVSINVDSDGEEIDIPLTALVGQ